MRILTVILASLFLVMLSGCEKYFNEPPIIEEVAASKTEVGPGDEITINVVANDPDGDELSYEYEVSAGEIEGSGSIVTWIAPLEEGTYFINVIVRDKYARTQRSITMTTSGGYALPFTRTFILDHATFALVFPDRLGGGRSNATAYGSFTLLAEATGKRDIAALKLLDIDEKVSSFPVFLDIDKDGKIDTMETGEISITMDNIDSAQGELDIKTGNFFLSFRVTPEVPLFKKYGIEIDPVYITENGHLNLKTGVWSADLSDVIATGLFSGVQYMALDKGGGSEPEEPPVCEKEGDFDSLGALEKAQVVKLCQECQRTAENRQPGTTWLIDMYETRWRCELDRNHQVWVHYKCSRYKCEK